MPTPPRDRPPDEPGDIDSDRLQSWLTEPGTPEFAAEARRQSLLAANSPHAEEDQAFVDSIADMFSEDGLSD